MCIRYRIGWFFTYPSVDLLILPSSICYHRMIEATINGICRIMLMFIPIKFVQGKKICLLNKKQQFDNDY